MSEPASNAFFSGADAYDSFMGRFSRQLSQSFINLVPMGADDQVLDLGCGTGALTGALVGRLGASSVSVLDPSAPFLKSCVNRYPGITGKIGTAEDIPFGDHSFDALFSQLVIHFFVDTKRAGREMMRVTRPGGWIAASSWAFDRMQLLNTFNIAARNVTGEVPTREPSDRFFVSGGIAEYFSEIGLGDVTESTIEVTATYRDLDELWSTYSSGIGPIGGWMRTRTTDEQAAIRTEVSRLIGNPSGEFTLSAVAYAGVGRTPGREPS